MFGYYLTPVVAATWPYYRERSLRDTTFLQTLSHFFKHSYGMLSLTLSVDTAAGRHLPRPGDEAENNVEGSRPRKGTGG